MTEPTDWEKRMNLTRRSFLILAGAGAAAGSLLRALPSEAASAAGDVVGKITVGYQGWFACIGDGAPINGWWHWSQNWSQPPSPSNNAIKAWPDMAEYAAGYQTAYSNLNGGGAATLFSSFDQQSVNTHFLWMQQNGCDTAALQRFNPNSSEGPTRDAMAAKVRSAAEASGRKFYIMYDVTGWTTMQPEIKTDWTSKMSAHTASSAYAFQNGKPVVCIWGFGFNDSNHPWDAATCGVGSAWPEGRPACGPHRTLARQRVRLRAGADRPADDGVWRAAPGGIPARVGCSGGLGARPQRRGHVVRDWRRHRRRCRGADEPGAL